MSVSACPQNPREKKEERLALSQIKLLRSIKRCGNACPHATIKVGAEGGQGEQAWQERTDRERHNIAQQAHTQQHTAHDDTDTHYTTSTM